MAVESGSYDEATLARQKVAAALLGKTLAPEENIRHWTQGLANMAKAGVGGYMGYQANQERAAEKAQGADDVKTGLAALLNGFGGASAGAAPTASPIAPPAPGAADTTGKIYSNNEPSPLDPPSGADRDKALMTILGEAGNQGPQGMQAVGSVIRNRAVDGSYGGNTPSAVVQSPNQFEPWNTDVGKQKMAAMLNNPGLKARADAALGAAYGEGGRAPDDPTEGKTLFYAPGAQAALGRPAPSWAQGEGQKIGDHVFYDDNSAMPTAAAPAAGTLPATAPSGLSPDKVAVITRLLNSNNPTAKALGMAAITNLTKQDTPINVGGKLVTPQGKVVYDGGDTTPKFGVIGEDAMGRKQYGFANPDKQTVTPVAPQGAAAAVPDNLADLHGPEYMAAIKAQDPKLANQVQAIIEGRAPYPTGMLLKTPYGQALAQHVTQADPSFESGNATARVKTRNEFMTGGVGSPAGQITAGNTALQHAGEMSDALERMKEGGGLLRGLGNAGIPVVSYGANALKNKSVQGTPEGAALNDFMTAKNHFSEEVTKFYAGSAGSEAERTRALANLDAAKSLPELRSAIKTEVNLMQGKVNALQDRWKNGMGPLVREFPLIQPKSQEAIDRVIQRHQASEQPAASPASGVQTATNPQTGEKLMLKDGQWVPMK